MAKKKQSFLSAVITAAAIILVGAATAFLAGDYIASIGKTFKPTISHPQKAEQKK